MRANDLLEKRLIVNGDDLGMSRGITDGILLAHHDGIVTSASLMVNMPASAYAVERLKAAPKLGVGVHLNICQGAPILPAQEVQSLVGADGKFLGPEAMIRKLWRWQASGHEIEAEFRAQIRHIRQQGIEPTHADSHHHMHIYPAAVRPFLRALAAEGIHCARAARCSQWPRNGMVGGPHKGHIVRRLFVQAYRGALQSVAFRGLVSPDSRVAFLRGHTASIGEVLRQWTSAFASLPSGTFELACHPGISEPGFSGNDAIAAHREQELYALINVNIRETLDRNQIRLISYNDLLAVRAPFAQAAKAPAL